MTWQNLNSIYKLFKYIINIYNIWKKHYIV